LTEEPDRSGHDRGSAIRRRSSIATRFERTWRIRIHIFKIVHLLRRYSARGTIGVRRQGKRNAVAPPSAKSDLASQLAKGIFARPAVYPATVRFANADSHMNSDFKADVRSLSVSVDLTCGGARSSVFGVDRQDFSPQNATTLPINDARAFLATMKVLTASSPAKSLFSLSLRDKITVFRTIPSTELQEHQTLKPYQQLRYWSTVPFCHGSLDVVKQSATPSPSNPSHAMSSFDFGLQFLDTAKMTYWGERQDADFWIENASVAWQEAQAPFHKVQLSRDAGEAVYFDVTGNAAADSAPIGSINRARRSGEVASRRARTGAAPL
jgi:hypothetical protein